MSPKAVHERIEAITRQEHDDLIRFIQQYSRSSSVAEDVLQEAYLEALRCAAKIEHPERLIAWLKTVAKRLAFEEIGKQKRIIEKCQYCLTPEYLSSEDEMEERIILGEVLSDTLRNYPLYYATVIHYRYYYRMPYAQIARELGITAAAARQINSRVIRKLREKLREEF